MSSLVFAMPQSGPGVSVFSLRVCAYIVCFEAALQVEAVDPVFQTKMLEMLKQTGRPEMVVGALLLTPCAAAAKVLCS